MININLTKEEAIVLFEFLTRINEKEKPELFEDQAEQRVLWDIESMLENELSEPFRADYQVLVEKAREKVRDQEESN